MLSDIEIAQQVKMQPVTEIGKIWSCTENIKPNFPMI